MFGPDRTKKAFPWLIYETLPDGTIVVAGDILKDFQYGKHLCAGNF